MREKGILIFLPEEYSEAAHIMSKRLGFRSRKVMIETAVIEMLDRQKGLLEEVNRRFSGNYTNILEMDMAAEQSGPIVKYKMFLISGGFDFMEGVTPGDALTAFHGKKLTHEDFLKIYTHYKIVE